MVEAVNKILKYNFLFPYTIANTEELKKLLPKQIEIYNSVRPHYSLKGLTPDKVCSGVSFDDINYMKSVNLIQNNQKIERREVTCDLC